jgi:hypothetical protein
MFLTSTTSCVTSIVMSQNGEASTSNATRPTLSTFGSSEFSEEQRQMVDKCTNIIQEFRSGTILRSKALLLLQRAIPHDSTNKDLFMSTYKSCSKTSIVTGMATSVGLIMSINTSQKHQPVNKMTTMTNQPQPALLGHLSDNVHQITIRQ